MRAVIHISFLLFQLSAVEAGGSTAFIYANFSVPVVKVRGTCTRSQEWGTGGGHSSPISYLLQRVTAQPIPTPNPNLPLPDVLECQRPALELLAPF